MPKTVKQTTPSVETVTPEPVQKVSPKKNVKATRGAPVVAAPVIAQEPVVAQEPVLAAAPVAAAEPVLAAAPLVAAPVKTKKAAKSKESDVSPPVVAAVVASTTAVAASQPVDAAPVDAVQSGGAKKRVAKVKVVKPVAESTEQTAGKPVVKKQAKVKAVAPKKVKEPEPETADDESGDRRVRSFKVKLPNKEAFEGRFTGLTPYQAANKALSKYFRETETPKTEITFEICESTRKSKRSVYTYVGKRYQLDVPVKYTIQDGREIVKNFKNSLKKVKKVDLAAEQVAGAPVVVPTVA